MASSFNLGTLPAVSSATGGSVPPSSLAESGASPPSAGGHIADEKSTLKTHRQDLANLIKIWYAWKRYNHGSYHNKELWDRKGNWTPVWELFKKDMEGRGGADWDKLSALILTLQGLEQDVLRCGTQVLSIVPDLG